MYKIIIALILTLSSGYAAGPFHPSVEAYFSPSGGCTEAIVREIRKAKIGIMMQAYCLTSRAIVEEIIAAHHRGVDVNVVLDKVNCGKNGAMARALVKDGILVMVDRSVSIMHSKVIMIDGTTLITGSFNFTESAERRNAENLLILKGDENLIKTYFNAFMNEEDRSVKFEPELEKAANKPMEPECKAKLLM